MYVIFSHELKVAVWLPDSGNLVAYDGSLPAHTIGLDLNDVFSYPRNFFSVVTSFPGRSATQKHSQHSLSL